MKLLFSASLGAVLLSTGFAAAADGVLWKQTKYWGVYAYPRTPSCIASTGYPTKGDQIMIGIDTKGWFLSIASRTMKPLVEGQVYTLPVATSLGTSGTYYGKAINSQQVMIDSFTYADLYSWAQASRITIVGMGLYNLKGSKDAIISLKACGDAMVELNRALAPVTPQAPATPQASSPAQQPEQQGIEL